VTAPGRLRASSSPRWGGGVIHDGDRLVKVIDLERAFLGGAIDLDPCSERVFEPEIGATVAYSLTDRDEDGLALPWGGELLDRAPLPPRVRVHCNPPGGLVREFWHKSLEEWGVGRVHAIAWVGFSVEQLCVLADEKPHQLDFATCFLRRRISFARHDGHAGSPSHANYITLVGGDPFRFACVMAPHGRVELGVHARQASAVSIVEPRAGAPPPS
jgi:hypothetical protein